MPPFSRLYLTFTELVWAIVTLFRPFIHNSMSPPQRVYQTSTMFTLPDELVLKIMTNLGIQDLHSCAQVCRSFSQLVRTDVRLQLNIGLRRTGMIEGAPSPVHDATADKSTALRQYARRYRNNSFELQRVSFGQDEACTWQRNLDGSVCYVRRRDTEKTIDFCVHRLSSPVRGLEAKSWEVSMREFVGGALYGVTADVAQDLAVISSSSLTSWDVRIRLLSLEKAGEDHPAASVPILHTIPTVHPNGGHFDAVTKGLEIKDRYLSYVLASRISRTSDIEVWDWKVGRKIWHRHYNSFELSSTLVGDYVVVVRPDRTSLDIFRLSGGDALFAFLLPPPVMSKELSITGIHTSAPPAPTADTPRPFQTDPTSALVVVSFEVRDRTSKCECMLLIPISTILHYGQTIVPSRPQRALVWAAWGTRGSAVVYCKDAYSAAVALRPFGAVLPLVYAESGAPPWPSALLDLHPDARAVPSAAQEAALARVRTMMFDDPAAPALFSEPVRTQLSYAVHAGPQLFSLHKSCVTTRVDAVDGGVVAMNYQAVPSFHMLGFDAYVV